MSWTNSFTLEQLALLRYKSNDNVFTGLKVYYKGRRLKSSESFLAERSSISKMEMPWNVCFLGIYIAVLLVPMVCTNTTCPTWHYYNNATGKCECGFMLQCSSDVNKVEISNTHCATPLGQEGDYYIGVSLFLYTSENGSRGFSEMPGNTSQLQCVVLTTEEVSCVVSVLMDMVQQYFHSL